MSGGHWIKLHRKISNWEWWDDVNTAHLFIHCLLRANFEDARWHGEVVKRGSFVTGREKLSKETGLTQQQVRTSLKKLQNTGEISVKSTNKYTVINICNYNDYQINDKHYQPTNNQQVTNNQPTNNQQVTSKNSNGGTIYEMSENLNGQISTNNQPNETDCNYNVSAGFNNRYQPTNNQQVTNNQPTNNQQVTTSKKNKEIKKNKEYISTTITDAVSFYLENFGQLAPITAEEIIAWINDTNEELVLHAMKIAIDRNNRSWGYVKGILKNWQNKNVKTVQQANAADTEFKNKQSTKRTSFSKNISKNKKEVVPKWMNQEKQEQQEITPDIEERRKNIEEWIKNGT